ncbi:MAG: hypothetical protein P8Y47_01430 [Alphaproteobacteria bacterium]
MDPDLVRQQEEEEAASRLYSRVTPSALARAGLTVSLTSQGPAEIFESAKPHSSPAASLAKATTADANIPPVPEELAISADKAAALPITATPLPVLVTKRPRYAKRQISKRPIWFASLFNVLFVAAGIAAGLIFGVKQHLSPLHEFFVCAGAGYLLGLISAVDWLRRSCHCALWRAIGVVLWPVGITWITQLMALALATYFPPNALFNVGGLSIPVVWGLFAAGAVASYVLAVPSMADAFRQIHPPVRTAKT